MFIDFNRAKLQISRKCAFIACALAILLAGYGYAFSRTPLAVGGNKNPLDNEISALNKKLQSRKTEIDRLKDQAEIYRQKIFEHNTKANSLKNEIQIFDAQIAKFSIEIKAREQEIALTELNIREIQENINAMQTRIADQKNRIAGILRVLYQSNAKSDLEILLLNDSLSDFFNQVKFIEDLHSGLHKQLIEFKETVDNLSQARAEFEAENKTMLRQKTALEQEQYHLKDQEKARTTLLAETRSSERKFRSLVADLKEEEQAVDSEIISLERSIRERIEKQEKENKFKERGIEALRWPIPRDIITAYFHDPNYPFRYVFEHPAIDIRAKQGTEIQAALSGYIAKARTDPGCDGRYSYIMIIHANGLSTVYGHVNKIDISEGDFVVQGQRIGASGGTPGTCGSGRLTTGPHLHFEVRLNGIPVDPLAYLN